MLYGIDYATDNSQHDTPRFFQARIDRGVLHVPPRSESRM
jgi:hypothetical protein